MGFSLKRIWQAYAFEHPQFWQRIDAPGTQTKNNTDRTLGTTVRAPLSIPKGSVCELSRDDYVIELTVLATDRMSRLRSVGGACRRVYTTEY